MASAASIFPEIAGFNPTGVMQQSQLRQQQLGLNAIQAQRQQAEIPLIQQQTQEARIKNQLASQGLRDNQIIQQSYADTDEDFWKDPQSTQKFAQKLQQGGISYPGLASWQEFHTKQGQAYTDLQAKDIANRTNQFKLEEDLHERAGDILQNYAKVPDAQKPFVWARETYPRIAALLPGHYAADNPLAGPTLDTEIGFLHSQKALLEQNKEKAGIGLQEAQTGEAKARTETEQLKTQVEKHQLELYDLLSKNPTNLQQRVAKSINPQQFPQEFNAAVNEMQAQPDYKSMMSVLEKHSQNVSEQVRQKAIETDPDILAAKRKTSQLQASYEDALRRNDEADKQYYESAVGFNTTKASAQSIQKVVELAQSGNPAAAQQLKALMPEFTNAMMDIKRLGGGQNDKNFTSAFDTAMDTADSILKGKPFTASTLQQVMPYIRTITNGAAAKHNAIVDTVNRTYNKKYGHEDLPYQDIANPKTPSGTARKVGDSVTLKGGKKVTITKVYPDGSFDY